MSEKINKIDKDLLNEVSNLENMTNGAYNIRKNGQGIERKVTENINIVTKTDKPGIDVYVKENTKFEFIHIPVIITESGLKDLVYNDFYIGKNANVIIIAGCGIHNDHHKHSQHDAIHRFYLEERAKVRYIDPLCNGERISKCCKIAKKMIEDNLYYDMDNYIYLDFNFVD